MSMLRNYMPVSTNRMNLAKGVSERDGQFQLRFGA